MTSAPLMDAYASRRRGLWRRVIAHRLLQIFHLARELIRVLRTLLFVHFSQLPNTKD
ncbi:MAG: hypothetical protein Cons2KO_00270 [Congregibacter sp.]